MNFTGGPIMPAAKRMRLRGVAYPQGAGSGNNKNHRRFPRRGRVASGFTRRIGNYGRYNGPARLKPELKYQDVILTLAASTGTTSSTLATGCITQMAGGTDVNQRVGRKITVKSLHVKGDVSLGAGATPQDVFHIWVILDTQANGAYATVSDIFNTAGTYIGQAMRNLSNSSRFKILAHRTATLDANALTGIGL